MLNASYIPGDVLPGAGLCEEGGEGGVALRLVTRHHTVRSNAYNTEFS